MVDSWLGIGNVTLVDHNKVTEDDVRNNFFLDPESVGQSKAQSAAELLQELNEDAKVSFIEKVNANGWWLREEVRAHLTFFFFNFRTHLT